MTIELPTAALLSVAGGGLVAITGWVVRALVLDRIKALEDRVEGQGKRFGEDVKEIQKWQAAHDAVEGERELSQAHDGRVR
jgi:hypothetical protein